MLSLILVSPPQISELTVALKSNSLVPDMRAKAMASMQTNKLALLRKARQVQAKHVTAAASQPAIKMITPTKPLRHITYRRLQKEVAQRAEDVKSFRLKKEYTEYGSSNGEWRNVSCTGRRYVLPDGCAPRKSRRING